MEARKQTLEVVEELTTPGTLLPWSIDVIAVARAAVAATNNDQENFAYYAAYHARDAAWSICGEPPEIKWQTNKLKKYLVNYLERT